MSNKTAICYPHRTSAIPIALICAAFSIGLVLLLGLDTKVSAQDQSNHAPDVTGSISGMITNIEQEPLAGMVVAVYRRNIDHYGEEDWDPFKSVMTDDAGQYTIDLLVTDLYRVGASDPNGLYLSTFYTGTADLEEATDVSIAGEAIAGLNVEMMEGGSIHGMVTNNTGDALSEIGVLAYQRTAVSWELVEEISTSESGEYVFQSLAPGSYALKFSDDEEDDYNYNYNDEMRSTYVAEYYENAASLKDATEILIASGAVVTNVNAQLDNYGGITGTIVIGAEAAHYGITVDIYSSEDDFQEIVATTYNESYYDDSNTYNFDRLKPGTYLARASAYDWHGYGDTDSYVEFYDNAPNGLGATKIVVESGQVTPNIDFSLDIVPTPSTLKGTVSTITGAPIEGVVIAVGEHCSDDTYYDYYYGYGCDAYYYDDEAIIVATDAGGNFLIPEISLQTHHIRVRDPNVIGGTAQLPTLFTYVPQSYLERIDPGENVLDISMEMGGAIVGSISTWDERVPSQGSVMLYEYREPFWVSVSTQEIIVNPEPQDDSYIYSDSDDYPSSPYPLLSAPDEQSEMVPNSFGFAFMGLPTGQYRVGVTGNHDDEYYSQFYGNATDIDDATTISVTAGVISDSIDIVIGEDNANASIDGYVMEKGVPQSDVKVELYRHLHIYDEYDEFNHHDWYLLAFTETDIEGYYNFAGLAKGDYKLRFVAQSSSDVDIYYGGAYSLEEAQVIQVGPDSEPTSVRLGNFDTVAGTQVPDTFVLYAPVMIR